MDPRNTALAALRSTQDVGIPLTAQMVSNTPLGSFWITGGYVGTGATHLPIQLPRQPSGIIVVDNNSGAVVYRTASDVSATTPTDYVCRATQGVSILGLVG